MQQVVSAAMTSLRCDMVYMKDVIIFLRMGQSKAIENRTPFVVWHQIEGIQAVQFWLEFC